MSASGIDRQLATRSDTGSRDEATGVAFVAEAKSL
jgi:hypothetical protein